jgi:BASS family bile acid:Na+ symporter
MLKEIAVDPVVVGMEIFLVLGTPLLLGMLLRNRFEALALKITKPIKNISLIIFAVIVIGAIAKEATVIATYASTILWIVVVHNASGFVGGYWFGRMFRLPERDCRSVSIETGLQNSGLGLGLVCSYFDGLGGMAMVAAAWGVWHLISGGTIALYWSRKQV